MTDDAETLRQRLNQFATRHSRAEIARKTGTSVMNVSRYLKSTRVPGEFCMALVREFGLNPAWLLAGQGGPYVSDLATQHGQMAGNLLELVEAMSAVAKMRLGSIAGKDHMKLLRQLNDSLGTYERLREKLNSQSREILGDVLRELDGALASMDMARAGALRKAAEQVARLSDDDELERRLLGMQAHHSYLTGRLDDALQYMRKHLSQSMLSGRIESEEHARGALRLLVVLSDSGQMTEALRLGRALLELAGDEAQRFPSIAGIGAFFAHVLCNRGEVHAAMAMLEKWTPLQDGRPKSVSQALLVKAQLIAGVISFEDAMRAPGLDEPKHSHILSLACTLEDAPAIRAAMKYIDTKAGQLVKERLVSPHVAPLLARALERKDKRTVKEFAAVRRQLEARPGATVELDILESQLLLVLGNKKQAARICEASGKHIAAWREPAALELPLRVSHARNRMQLLGSTEARNQIAEIVDGGCRLFRPLLD